MRVSRNRWGLVPEVLFLLILTEVGLRLLGVRRLVATIVNRSPIAPVTSVRLSRSTRAERSVIGRADAVDPAAIAAFSHSLLLHLPFRVTCLARSLVVFWLLRRREVPVRLVLGVKPVSSRFYPHAWVEVGGTEILEPDKRRLIPIARLG